MRRRVQISPASHDGLHCGTHWPAWQANPGEQIGTQAASRDRPATLAAGGARTASSTAKKDALSRTLSATT